MTKMIEFEDHNGTVRLSEEQVNLLKNQVVDKGKAYVTFFEAKKHYSGKNPAKNALQSMETKGILDQSNQSKWLIKGLPKELYDRWVG